MTKLDLVDITAILAEVGVSLCDLMDGINSDPEGVTYTKDRVLAVIQMIAIDISKTMLLAAGKTQEAVNMCKQYPDMGVIEIIQVSDSELDLAANQRPLINKNSEEKEDDGKVWN
jgi:hypothetical protein